MSITVENLLRLPSLREAKVIAGKQGLSKIVSSISVLEYANPEALQDSLFQNSDFYGSEIVITAFVNIKDDVEAQCANIRRLAQVGEVGLILYYVGIYMPKIHEKLIRLADELGFTLISMPDNRMDLRYSEVICEVMELIIKDQMTRKAFVSELLERISKLSEHQQTVDTILRMLSDRIHASVVLTDDSKRILNEAMWPRNNNIISKIIEYKNYYKNIRKSKLGDGSSNLVIYNENNEMLGYLYYHDIRSDNMHEMKMIIFKEGEPLIDSDNAQASEVVQLAVNIWGRQHDEIIISELVRAIMRDEPMKMRRLADIFHINVAKINTMWIIDLNNKDCVERNNSGKREQQLKKIVDISRRILDHQSEPLIIDIYENSVVIFMCKIDYSVSEELSTSLLSELKNNNLETVLVLGNELQETKDVRNAYLKYKTFLDITRIIFKEKSIFTIAEIEFAAKCSSLIEEGEVFIQNKISILSPLRQLKESEEIIKTLSVYLLDAHANIALTAELVYLHKNTIKYRIHKIEETLGYSPDKMPETIELYNVVAINRLLSKR